MSKNDRNRLFVAREKMEFRADIRRLGIGGSRTLRSIFLEAHRQLQGGRGIPHDRFWQEVERLRKATRGKPAGGKAR